MYHWSAPLDLFTRFAKRQNEPLGSLWLTKGTNAYVRECAHNTCIIVNDKHCGTSQLNPAAAAVVADGALLRHKGVRQTKKRSACAVDMPSSIQIILKDLRDPRYVEKRAARGERERENGPTHGKNGVRSFRINTASFPCRRQSFAGQE